ncbi:GNAT family N-acetyltransferase [Sphingomonas sp.]|uniref:GNAT family N-acetyltransferase n=1 Tax=Sphingomonas sp. TaxID=28214 RepID=UPI00286B388B|nr:GNAT family N-acetyltransferase [Sphingomonas sp.]
MTGLTILEYEDSLAGAFTDINAEWIGKMFVLEPHDEHVLSHPRETIVDRGGVILFIAGADGEVLGTGALMPTGGGGVELTKMGVREAARGTGAGAVLLDALVARGRAMGADPLYLLTSSRCEAAIHLYEKVGFVHDPAIMARYGGTYQRADVAMRHPG